MTEVQQERERCAKLVDNLIRRHKDNRLWRDKLKELAARIRNPKSTGAIGGPLTEQLELPFDN